MLLHLKFSIAKHVILLQIKFKIINICFKWLEEFFGGFNKPYAKSFLILLAQKPTNLEKGHRFSR